MYKKFVMGIAAMAALTLVSCSSDDLDSFSDNSSKNEAISFDGYLGRSAVAVNGSRGSVLDKTALQNSTEGFGVFGNYSSTDGATPTYGENLFKNEKVTYSSSNSTSTKWAYTNTKYWPTQGHIDFLAYAPYDSNQKLIENSKLEFKVSPTATEQKDLLWANAANKKKTGNPVKFTFNHALAKIGYSVKLKEAYSGATITLKKISLAGSATEPTKEAFYTKGTIDLSKTSSDANLWTISTPAEKQDFNWFSATQALSTTGYNNPNTEYLFVIPQDFSQKTSGADELYVIVEYTVELPLQTGTTEPMITSVSRKLTKNFEQGKAYMINLTIGLTPIEFDAEVTPWGNDDPSDITWN